MVRIGIRKFLLSNNADIRANVSPRQSANHPRKFDTSHIHGLKKHLDYHDRVGTRLLRAFRVALVARLAPSHASSSGLSGDAIRGSNVPGFTTRILTVRVGGHAYKLRVLSDTQQFADPDGHADRLGISSAQWSLFGQLWPSGKLLAKAMDQADIQGKRVLEIGCGIGLASLVLQRRGAEVVATDMHPLAESFLAYNAALNGLPAVHYRQLSWAAPLPTLGDFDLIIASDVLYERGQAELLADVITRHARPQSKLVFTDPGRGHSGGFTRLLAKQGFDVTESHCAMDDDDTDARGRLLEYVRSAG